jgi:hypothetical protein
VDVAVRQRTEANKLVFRDGMMFVQLACLEVERGNGEGAGLLLHTHSPRIRFVAVEPKPNYVVCELTTTLTVRRLPVAVLGMKSNLIKG